MIISKHTLGDHAFNEESAHENIFIYKFVKKIILFINVEKKIDVVCEIN